MSAAATRVAITVSGAAPKQPHTGARGATYSLLAAASPALAEDVHAKGWAGSGRRPWSTLPPAPGRTSVEYLTPIPDLADAFAEGARRIGMIRWGESDLEVVSVDSTPVAAGYADQVWECQTPVVVHGPPPKLRPVAPGEVGWSSALRWSIRSAADWLGCEPPTVVSTLAGRRVVVPSSGQRSRVAAECVCVRVVGDPEQLSRIAALGVGSRAVEGFGWVPPVEARQDLGNAEVGKDAL